MIPKIIHYCWFGRTPLSDDVKKCIASWNKFFPDYEIKEWNEDNFNINCCKFVNQAYERRKWAFVSDYVRLYVIYNFGGVYFDTDIEACKNMSKYLAKSRMLFGFEDEKSVMTGFFASEPKSEFLGELLNIYNNKTFILSNGKLDTSPNPIIFTEILSKYGLELNGKEQEFSKSCYIYPYDYFSAFNISFQKYDISKNTCLIHHCNGSWQTPKDKFKQKIKSIFLRIFGKQFFEYIKNRLYKRKGM